MLHKASFTHTSQPFLPSLSVAIRLWFTIFNKNTLDTLLMKLPSSSPLCAQVLDWFSSHEWSKAMTAITFSQVALRTGYRWTGVRKQGKAAAEFHLVHRSEARAGQRSGMSTPARVFCCVSAISIADTRQCSWQCHMPRPASWLSRCCQPYTGNVSGHRWDVAQYI